MDDVPTRKAITMTATMESATMATKAAATLLRTGGFRRTDGGGAVSPVASDRPIHVHVKLELDGEVLAEHTEKVIKDKSRSGGFMSALEGLLA